MNLATVKPILLALAIYLSGINCAMSQNTPAPSLSMYAGKMSEGGSSFSVNVDSRLAADSAGNLYVSFQSSIFKIAANGQTSKRELKRWNNDIKNIGAMAIAPDGVLYFLDCGRSLSPPRESEAGGPGNWLPFSGTAPPNYQSIYKLSLGGSVKQVAGKSANIAIGGFAMDSKGDLYAAGGYYNTSVQKIRQRRLLPSTVEPFLASRGGDAGGRLDVITGIAIDAADNIYLGDAAYRDIRKISPSGVASVLVGPDAESSIGGLDAAASFELPRGIVVDASGNLYVIDYSTQVVRKITPAGDVSTLVGTRGGGDFQSGALPGIISHPIALAISGSSLYILMASGSGTHSRWAYGGVVEGSIAVVKNLF